MGWEGILETLFGKKGGGGVIWGFKIGLVVL